jgi:hypothetical protein
MFMRPLIHGKYRDVMLLITALRPEVRALRHQGVTTSKHRLDRGRIVNQDAELQKVPDQDFYDTSPFTVKSLTWITTLHTPSLTSRNSPPTASPQCSGDHR